MGLQCAYILRDPARFAVGRYQEGAAVVLCGNLINRNRWGLPSPPGLQRGHSNFVSLSIFRGE